MMSKGNPSQKPSLIVVRAAKTALSAARFFKNAFEKARAQGKKGNIIDGRKSFSVRQGKPSGEGGRVRAEGSGSAPKKKLVLGVEREERSAQRGVPGQEEEKPPATRPNRKVRSRGLWSRKEET